jgi:hypothetical protein
MTTPPKTPCQQNNDITFEEHQNRVAHAEMLWIAIKDSGASEEVKIAANRNARRRRLEHHPDHWFIAPISGRDTEPGRLRRRAIKACFADCPMKARLLCLEIGLQGGPVTQYGIYGGRTEKERQEIVTKIEQRKAGRLQNP